MKKTALFLCFALLCLMGAGCRVVEEPEPLITEEPWNTAEHIQIDSREENGFLFLIYSDRTCTLAEVDSSKWTEKTLVLPSSCRGVPVTAIGDRVFAGKAYEEVILPDSLRFIGAEAFQKCALRRLVLPDSVVEIGAECFDNCLLLESVTFGAGLKAIPTGAFFSCSSLKKILLPEGVEEVGEEAFAACGAAEEVLLPSTLLTIGDYAFWRTGIPGLVISVPEGASVGEHAFEK